MIDRCLVVVSTSCWTVHHIYSSLGVRPRLQSAEVAAMEYEDRIDEDDVPTRTTPGSSIPVWKIACEEPGS